MVTCQICGVSLKAITNTHLRTHNTTTEEYAVRFPHAPRVSEETTARKSQTMMGKNVGNQRPDARARMNESNPMKDSEVAAKMGKTRSARISLREIDALRNLGHLPTQKEKDATAVLKELNIPLVYVGDGKTWIGNRCPDFICEEKKIVAELDLDMFYHEKEKQQTRDYYLQHGYLCIILVKTDREYLRKWLSPFFQGGPRWERIRSLTTEPTTGNKRVFNYHVSPNNNYFAERLLVHNCFADAFRASLYTSFFDNSKSMGLRHCNPEFFITELDKSMKFRGQDPHTVKGDVNTAIAMGIPMRFGIRFEDFLPIERKKGVSLSLLRYLADLAYPVMINTKSNLVGEDDYLRALADNKGRAAVHITMISSNSKFLKLIEPGAPSFEERLEAARRLTNAGIRVVARIEPYMIHINDSKAEVEDYMDRIHDAGIRHLTFDTYSYSANNPGIRAAFERDLGIDFRRMFLLTSDSQGVGSLLLSKFMELFRERGFSCSSFDLGGVPDNDDHICCEVGDWFYPGSYTGFNWGSIVIAAKFIASRGTRPTRWVDFENMVMRRGGFLSSSLFDEVKRLWNLEGNNAYAVNWADGIEPYGRDEDGIIWRHRQDNRFREKLVAALSRI